MKEAGSDYLFLEVDRATEAGNDSKELALYSLQLEESYNIFGFQVRRNPTEPFELRNNSHDVFELVKFADLRMLRL